jgi:hypothetical protein
MKRRPPAAAHAMAAGRPTTCRERLAAGRAGWRGQPRGIEGAYIRLRIQQTPDLVTDRPPTRQAAVPLSREEFRHDAVHQAG